MKLTESRKAMIARHVQEVELAVDVHKSHMASMMERQRLELIELMLVEDTRQKPHDVIELLQNRLEGRKRGECPGSVEYEDTTWLLRILNDFSAAKFPPLEGA